MKKKTINDRKLFKIFDSLKNLLEYKIDSKEYFFEQ